ncbi:MAG: phosphoribosylglycinamide formyltransferase [Fibrobacter sp.]|nr:phosphoribosylglycinamide formyltransferase [Fibrobacter sp.]
MINKKNKVAFFASGGGSNFQAILDKINSQELSEADPVLLISNNSKCGAVLKAQEAQVAVAHISGYTHKTEEQQAQAMVQVLQKYGVEWIVLAGYMKKIPALVLEKWKNRIINIHPALLPAFGGTGMWGHHVHKAVIASGVRVSGATVHFVDEIYDNGAIIAQKSVPVFSEDTPKNVAERVLVVEHDLYWRALQGLLSSKIYLQGSKVYGDIQ